MSEDNKVTSDVIAEGIVKAAVQLACFAGGGWLLWTSPWLLLLIVPVAVVFFTFRESGFVQGALYLVLFAAWAALALSGWMLWSAGSWHHAPWDSVAGVSILSLAVVSTVSEAIDRKKRAAQYRAEFEKHGSGGRPPPD